MTTPAIANFQFREDDLKSPELTLRALNAFGKGVWEQFMELRESPNVTVLDDITFTTGGSLALNTAPFPLLVTGPRAIRGAWVVLLQTATGGTVSTNAAMAWVRPLGDTGQSEPNLSIDFITGLAVSTEYTIRLAVLHG